MKSVIIFGITDLAEELIYHLEHDDQYKVYAVTADGKYIPKEKKGGVLLEKYPIVPFEEISDIFPSEEYSFFICIGYSKMNEGRKKAFEKVVAAGYDVLNYSHPSALVQTEKIGKGNLFFENVTVGSYCTIGNGNVFYPCSHVAHHTNVGDFNFMAISCSVAGHVKIGNHCFFGNNSSTKDKIAISDRTLIGAGTYIDHDTSPESVWVPNRAICLEKKSFEIL